MPKFLEEKLKKEYGAKSDIPYKVMNKLGVMHGNKETAKGRREEKKHDSKTKALEKHRTPRSQELYEQRKEAKKYHRNSREEAYHEVK